MTRDDPARVASVLSDLTPWATEFVIGVDPTVPIDLLGPYAGLTDRVFVVDTGRGADVARNALLDRTDAEWVFAIDGDEVVSTELLEVVPRLLAADVNQHVIARRWCFPTIDEWLPEQPWWPDFQVRFLRRVPARPRRFGVLPHQGPAMVPPVAFQMAPLYHLATVLATRDARLARVAAYEHLRPGLVAPGGDPLNSTFYLPDDHDPRRRPTPDADRERLKLLLDHPPARPGGALPELVSITTAELDAYFPALALDESSYRVTITPVDQELRLAAGETWNLYVAVENRSATTLPGGGIGDKWITLSYGLADATGRYLTHDGPRTPLPAPIGPGETVIAPVRIDGPAVPGDYVAHVDLVHDGARWFGCSVAVPLRVGTRR